MQIVCVLLKHLGKQANVRQGLRKAGRVYTLAGGLFRLSGGEAGQIGLI